MPSPALPRFETDASSDRPLVAAWVRTAVILTVIPVWCLLMLFSLVVLKQLPGAEWTIVPSAVIAAVAPAWRIRRNYNGPTPAGTEPAPTAPAPPAVQPYIPPPDPPGGA